MSCYLIEYKNKSKVMIPITSREKYLELRGLAVHKDYVSRVRQGETDLKHRLLQFNYSCIPSDNGRLKGCKTPSTSVGMDIDHIAPEDMKALAELIVECKDELGLLMLERSVRGEGYHIVFRRHPEMTQEENLRWASNFIGVPFDEAAKDITRVFFATSADADDLIYLDDELFSPNPSPFFCPNERSGRAERPARGKGVDTPSICAPSERQGISFPLPRGGGGQGERPGAYDDSYDGIKYEEIVGAISTLLGGAPAHGSRNNFIFAMACYLRYVCNDDPDRIAAILPTYGEDRNKWRRTIESACQRSQPKEMPQIVRKALDNARLKSLPLGGEGEGSSALPPSMPEKLPALIAHLVKNVPEVCRPSVANAVFPSLAAHLNGVKFWLIDGTEKEATFMCVTMAPQSSGKSASNKPIEYIIADIVERDEVSRQREQAWKDAMAMKGANKEKPKRPDDLCVQVLVSDMTNAAFVQRMKDAGGKYLYTNIEELDLLRQLQTNGTKDVGKIICLCFDNGKYGQERVGTQSVTARVDLRWNWNAASTIQKGIHFFRGRLVDGTLSRINLCTIVPDKTKLFRYGRYDEQYAETLKPYITNLNMAQGHVECPEALELAQQMLDRCQEEAALTGNEVLEDMAFRAVTIAYLKAMVLYIASDMKWSEEIARFAEWSLDYDLWCKCHFFGQLIADEKANEVVKPSHSRQNLLNLLPDSFTLEQLIDVRRMAGMRGDAGAMARQWVFRGYIVKDEKSGKYIKTKRPLPSPH